MGLLWTRVPPIRSSLWPTATQEKPCHCSSLVRPGVGGSTDHLSAMGSYARNADSSGVSASTYIQLSATPICKSKTLHPSKTCSQQRHKSMQQYLKCLYLLLRRDSWGGLKCGLLNLEWCFPWVRAPTMGHIGILKSVNPENIILTNVKTRIHTEMQDFNTYHDCWFGSVINSDTTLNIWFSVAHTLHPRPTLIHYWWQLERASWDTWCYMTGHENHSNQHGIPILMPN